MESESSTLLLLLNDIGAILDTLLEIAGEKQRLVVMGDCLGLERKIKEEEEALESLNRLGTRFDEDNRFRLDNLAGTEELARLKADIERKVFMLRSLNNQNQKLIARSLEIVRYDLGLFLPKEDYFKALKTAPLVFDQKV
ncbi:MAG TPA: flagellar protein FlgN [Firmicutes bacterium]|nr:flagellar protein FlgN [Bacillota bacterium]